MTIKSCIVSFVLVGSFAISAVAQLQERPAGIVTMIKRKPHLDTDAEGSFSVKYNRSTKTIAIQGEVKNLSSPLYEPEGVRTAIHLHHFQLLDQPRPPIIETLDVDQAADELSAKFSGEFTLDSSNNFDEMFLAGMTFVLVHTENNKRGEMVGYIDFGDDSGALQWKKFQLGHPLIENFRNVNKNPVLPISRSESDDTVDSPFPSSADLPDDSPFLDKRSNGSGRTNEQIEAERYLRKPVEQVNSTTHVINGTDKKSFYDHPNVQPRPFRPFHMRYAGELAGVDILTMHPGQKLFESYSKQRSDSWKASNGFDPRKIYQHLPHLTLAPQGPITYADTPPAMYPEVDPFKTPPGTNLLPTVYENMRDRQGDEMVNTLPSHPNRPYNLHEGDPEVSRLDTLSSPTDDLRLILDEMYEAITGTPVRRIWEQLDREDIADIFNKVTDEEHRARIKMHGAKLLHHAEWAIDILEGNVGKTIDPVEKTERPSRVPGNRAYRGFALLHHSAHKRANRVLPVYDNRGKIIAGHVNVRQIWYDGRIESDTAYYDYGWDDIPIRVKLKGNTQMAEMKAAYRQTTDNEPQNEDYETRWYASTDPNLTPQLWTWSRNQTPVDEEDVKQLTQTPEPIPHDVPLFATFDVSVLNRGEDDFSTTIVHFDAYEKINLSKPTEIPWGKMNVDGDNVDMRFGPPHFAMDASFFPLQEGTRTKIRLKLSDAQYHNVHYTWGWRKHPPRAQAVENMHKRIPPAPPEFKGHYHVMWDHPTAERFFDRAIHKSQNVTPRLFRLRIDDHERFVFEGVVNIDNIVERYFGEELIRVPAKDGETPEVHRTRIRAKLAQDFGRLAQLKWLQPPPDGQPINKIADLSPAKQMWKAFRGIRAALLEEDADPDSCLYELVHARISYLDWKDRNHMPAGVKVDQDSDLTMLYVNNTLYGQTATGSPTRLDKWRKRGTDVKITLVNGDYFIHGYANPDFGGLRGYENQFKPTLAVGGQGSFFTFGRFNWRFNVVGGVVPVPPAHIEKRGAAGNWAPVPPSDIKDFGETDANGKRRYRVVPGVHRVMIRYNYEPSRRLRFYQFDPLHHDVAIYSIH